MGRSAAPSDEQQPLLRKEQLQAAEDDVVPSGMQHMPEAPWVWARKDAEGRRFPQTISHRGYKAQWPENTMRAFKEAVNVGTHAIETDIHLSKDDIVVLSHDPDLKRCYGEQEKVIDCDWSHLSELRTLREPHEPMPRLADLLEYVAHPDQSHIWILLDIKLDNNADNVMRLIAKTIKSATQPTRPWNERVVLGIWAAKFLPLCHKYLPGFPVSHICFSTWYARQFLRAPNVSFNMFQRSLFGPIGARFISDVKAAKRPLFSWTVNDENLMKWGIQKELDGIITDDPKKFNQICEEWDSKRDSFARVTLRQWLYTFWLWILISFFSFGFRRKFPEKVRDVLKLEQLKAKASTTRTLDT